MKKCRRCSECDGMSHHWIPNSDFGNDDEPEEISEAEYVCKHCDVLGEDCLHCFGDGDEPGLDRQEPCCVCDGEGVVVFVRCR